MIQQQLLSNWLNWRCYDTVFVSNCSKTTLKNEPTHFFFALCHFCWTKRIKSPFTFLRSVKSMYVRVSARARACVRCQSKRRLAFHLYSQSEIRGRSTALHSLQPNITLSLCWAHFWRGTPFYPRNQTGMTHSIWTPALFFFLSRVFFLTVRIVLRSSEL